MTEKAIEDRIQHFSFPNTLSPDFSISTDDITEMQTFRFVCQPPSGFT